MSHDKDKEPASQLWEPAGVLSVDNDDTTPKYGNKGQKNAKGGILSLEVEEVFHNKGIMEGTQLKD
ncbi:MAG TPA: hypothetical protein VFC84_02730 [Desulfosporosinus sp.]|nr:hypothetical protein [Desulfosporosinus sp.]